MGETFAVREGVATGPVGPVRAGADVTSVEAGPLERLRSGAIDVPQYVELKVAEATAHLVALPAAELEGIRAALRERLASDPGLAELREVVARAASQLDTDAKA
ncbi:MAG: hypothetical protein ACRENE_25155 [Polyangiaceae bacterium]